MLSNTSVKTTAGRYRLNFRFRYVLAACLLLTTGQLFSQYPGSCASVSSRANSNGQTNSCANVGGTPYAANFVGTSYATVPAASKTGNITLKYTGATSSLKPFAITKAWLTNPSTAVLPVSFGPAAVPAVSGSDMVVDYCFYGSNLPSIGTITFQFTNPQTGAVAGICSFDASCTSNCGIVSNPATLPVMLGSFTVQEVNDAVLLHWTTMQEINNKGFTIERSTTDSTFLPIGFVSAAHPQGYSSTPTNYSYTDNTLEAGTTARYRLRQEDLDGNFTYSASGAVTTHTKGGLVQVHSTGSQVHIIFSGSAQAQSSQVSVYDAQGRQVITKDIHAVKEYTINGLPGNGKLYYVHIAGKNTSMQYTRAVYIQY